MDEDVKKRINIIDNISFGTTTNPTSANQLLEFEQKIWEGTPVIEIGALKSDVFQSIPKEVFKEIAEKAKLTGTKISIHAPVQDIDLAGISREGYKESERELAKYRLKLVLDRASEIGEKMGYSVPVNVHSSSVGLREWDKKWEEKALEKLKKEKEIKPWYLAKRDIAVLAPTGEFYSIVEAREIETPFGKDIITLKDEIERLNKLFWSGELGEIRRYVNLLKTDLELAAKTAGKALFDPNKVGLFFNAIQRAEYIYNILERRLNEMYDWIRKYGKEEHRKELEKIKDKIEDLRNIKNKIEEYKKEMARLREIMEKPYDRYKEFVQTVFHNLLDLQFYRAKLLEEIENQIGRSIAMYGYPYIIKPASEIHLEKASETLAEVISEYIAKYKDKPEKIPKIVVENVFPEYYLSRSEELRELIDKAKEKALKILKEKYGFSESEAKKYLENYLGVTLDIGHVYKLKSAGYSEEDIKKEIEKIYPYIKHVHITDNYGDYDVHLVPGQAEAFFKNEKELKEYVKKVLDKAKEEGLFVISEAGGWYNYWSKEYGGPVSLLYSNLRIPIYTSLYPFKISYPEAKELHALGAGGVNPYVSITYEFPGSLYPIIPEYLQPLITQYHPLGYRVFSTLPPELGGTVRATFTGKKLE